VARLLRKYSGTARLSSPKSGILPGVVGQASRLSRNSTGETPVVPAVSRKPALPKYEAKSMPLSRRGGQALLIAVLIMMAILLVGALFVAIVNYNQQSSVRHSDMVAAQGLAEAGIRYADYMLQYSPAGADWRPPSAAGSNPPPAYTDGSHASGFYTYYTEAEEQHGWCPLIDAGTGEYIRFGFSRYPNPLDPSGNRDIGRGHFFLRVTYDPDPPYEPAQLDDPAHINPANPEPDPLSRYIRIESIGVVADEGFVFRQLVAYKPIALTDYLLFVTDRSRRAQPTILGYNPWLDMDKNGVLDFFAHEFYGPMRFNTPVRLEGQNSDPTVIPPDPADASTTICMRTVPAGTLPLDRPGQPEGAGYLRDDRFQTTHTVTEDYAAGSNFYVDAVDSTLPEAQGVGVVREGVDRLRPPELFAEDPATGTMRWYALTRDSGEVTFNASTGETFNTGKYGHGKGIYIDNATDIQFLNPDGSHNIAKLIQDWLGNIPDTDPQANQRGWNPVKEVYDQAPGVEIELFCTEPTTREDPIWGALSVDNSTSLGAGGTVPDGTIWWPRHVTDGGEPGIRLKRNDAQYWHDAEGNETGMRTMYLDYPQPGHQVIFAEGNVRISGRLPRRNVNPNNPRQYHLTIVSGGTIYIDGQILSPQDQYTRDVDGDQQAGATSPVTDEYNTYVALLARDCVVVNPTLLVPQTHENMIPQDDDDEPTQNHWVWSGTGEPSMFSPWYFGYDPVAAGNTVNLVVRQSRASHPLGDSGWDPATQRGAVAATEMEIYTAGSTNPYQFDTAGQAYDPAKFILAYNQPQVADLPGSDGVIGAGVDPTVPTDWALPVRPPAWADLDDTGDATPWNLAGYISPAPGALNQITLSPLLPGDAFFTPFLNPLDGRAYNPVDYWLKKFKIEEANGGSPVGAIHAKINAVMYAENGCFFVIPAPYFYEEATGPNAERFLRYNYDIEIRGTITENFHPGPAAVREWQEKWAFPDPTAGWNSIRYVYDETILAAREQPTTTLSGPVRSASTVLATDQANLPKHPLLPVSPDLIYYGQ